MPFLDDAYDLQPCVYQVRDSRFLVWVARADDRLVCHLIDGRNYDDGLSERLSAEFDGQKLCRATFRRLTARIRELDQATQEAQTKTP